MVIAVFSWILLSNIMLDDRPDVIFSHLDGKCIKVENVNPNDHYSCDNLPEKYNYYYYCYLDLKDTLGLVKTAKLLEASVLKLWLKAANMETRQLLHDLLKKNR